jgi:hypothetical protein
VRDSCLVLLLRREAADEQEVQSDVLESHKDNVVSEAIESFEVVCSIHGLLCLCRVSKRLLNSLVMPKVTFPSGKPILHSCVFVHYSRREFDRPISSHSCRQAMGVTEDQASVQRQKMHCDALDAFSTDSRNALFFASPNQRSCSVS